MSITIDDTVRLPVTVERGASGGPVFNTDVNIGGSGHVSTNQRWSLPLWVWDISYGMQTMDDVDSVRDVFIGARGRAYGFRFKDWSDYEIPVLQAIGTGDGVETAFQIYKRYTNGVRNMDRIITRPISGTLSVEVNSVAQTEGVDYTVSYSTGIITFTAPVPNTEVVTVLCEFDIPVMFERDDLSIALETFDAAVVESIKVREIRE